MLIDFDQTFLTLDGVKITDVSDKGEISLTLGRVVANALLAITEEEARLSGEEKVKRYELAKRVLSGTASLKAEEIAEIKKIVGVHYTPLIVGQAWKMLDPVEV